MRKSECGMRNKTQEHQNNRKSEQEKQNNRRQRAAPLEWMVMRNGE
jgi:hypothetical protein